MSLIKLIPILELSINIKFLPKTKFNPYLSDNI